MALLNRFSKLNDRAETGIFTFIVTKSVTRDFHRDATTKDFCFGYHRWAISFQRPTERVLGVHLLLRNPSPNTACVVDFTLTLLNRQHFSQNEVYTKRQAKFTITNPMQGVARWLQMSDLMERGFSNETGEFLFELSLSNMSTIFECDVQLNATTLAQYKCMLKNGIAQVAPGEPPARQESRPAQGKRQLSAAQSNSELISLETNYFTFGAFDWSLTIVPLVAPCGGQQQQQVHEAASASSSSSSSSAAAAAVASQPAAAQSASQRRDLEPVCRVYLNRLNGVESLCRVKYRVILGHHQPAGQHAAHFVDSRSLDQISDVGGRIRGYQFRDTNILKLVSVRSAGQSSTGCGQPGAGYQRLQAQHQQPNSTSSGSFDLRVHIEMFCANTVSEARVALQRRPNEPQVSNCSDRNKQAWCVESDNESEHLRLKLFFLDLQSVPRNHIRYISWIAYVVRRDSKSGAAKESIPVRNSPHSNYYLQDGIDMGTIMETDVAVRELEEAPLAYLDSGQLTVHVEWVDSLLLFSHLYNNYDSLATIQRHQISRELGALQQEFARLERKYEQSRRTLEQLLGSVGQQRQADRNSAALPLVPQPLQRQQAAASSALAARAADRAARTPQAPLAAEMEEGRPTNKSSLAQFERLSHSVASLKVRDSPTRQAQGGQLIAGSGCTDQWAAEQSQLASLEEPPMTLSERLQFGAATPPSSLAPRTSQQQPPHLQESGGLKRQQHASGRRLPKQPAEFRFERADLAEGRRGSLTGRRHYLDQRLTLSGGLAAPQTSSPAQMGAREIFVATKLDTRSPACDSGLSAANDLRATACLPPGARPASFVGAPSLAGRGESRLARTSFSATLGQQLADRAEIEQADGYHRGALNVPEQQHQASMLTQRLYSSYCDQSSESFDEPPGPAGPARGDFYLDCASRASFVAQDDDDDDEAAATGNAPLGGRLALACTRDAPIELAGANLEMQMEFQRGLRAGQLVLESAAAANLEQRCNSTEDYSSKSRVSTSGYLPDAILRAPTLQGDSFEHYGL